MPRPRINWFSPLPPASTDLAHYALRTLPALARRGDVVVWTERPYWPLEVEANAAVRQWDGESWAALNSADVTVYHVGNNIRFHGWIWNVARRHPGVVVLHDTRLHEFFAPQLLEAADGEAAYLAAVRRCHGEPAAREAERLLRGETTASALAERLPLTELALERARGAVVHTNAAFDLVAGFERCPVLQLDLPYDPGPPPPQRTWDGVLRLVVFGYLGANRRLDALLEAIATFPDRQRLRLDVFGQIDNAAALTERIEMLDIGDRVRMRGFVPEAELDETLDRSHLAVNLRYPTMGEASGSQLRIWSRGLASLVTRTGWYAELPPEAVGFVDPLHEAADLQAHFSRALAEPDTLRAMGDAGRRALETRHHPDLYAGQLMAGLNRMMRTPVSLLGEAAARVAGIADDSGMNRSARAELARRAAEELCRWTATPSRADT